MIVLSATIVSACQQGEMPAEPSVELDAGMVAAPAVVPKYSAEAFFQTTSYGMVGSAAYAFSADGTTLLVS